MRIQALPLTGGVALLSHLNLATLDSADTRTRLALGALQDEVLGQEEPGSSVLGPHTPLPLPRGAHPLANILVFLLPALVTTPSGPGYKHILLISKIRSAVDNSFSEN